MILLYRISWRRHAVDSAEMDQPESEDEIWDEATKVDSGKYKYTYKH